MVARRCHSFSRLTLSSLQIEIVTEDFKAELQARSKATNGAECMSMRYNLYDAVCIWIEYIKYCNGNYYSDCSDRCKGAYVNSWPWTCL